MLKEILNNYIFNNNLLILFLSLFFCVLFAIIILRIILNFVIDQVYKKYSKLKKILPKSQKSIKEEEELLRYKNNLPKAHSQVKSEINNMASNQELPVYELIERPKEQDLSQVEIVDIVKPIGFWTSMILGQKLTYLIQSAQMLNKKGSKGFWVSMVEAKDRVAGKQHSRGR
jgi:predicted PurR-regulated permease PerM